MRPFAGSPPKESRSLRLTGRCQEPYTMMRLVARSGSGAIVAKTDIVLPVSDCRTCHASC